MKIRFSQRFRDESRGHVEYIAKQNPDAARRVKKSILMAIDRLKRFPESGRAWRVPVCRELVIPGLPFIVIYEVGEDEITVLRLFHTSREWPSVH